MILERLGGSKTCHFSVPCGHPLSCGVCPGVWPAGASVQVQMLRSEKRCDLAKVTQWF